MAKIKRLINFGLPVTACNMRCSYCYVSQAGWRTDDLGQLDYSPEHIQKCLTKERLGGVCHVSMCGSGETLLPKYTIDLIARMLENGHYVSVVTNGTITERMEELCALPFEYKKRLFFKFSFHYLELKRHGLLETFFSNVKRAHGAGCAFTIELAADDSYTPHIEDIRRLCRENVGADCQVVELRQQRDEFARLTEIAQEERLNVWGSFDSALFDFQQREWGKKRCEFCYAGDWIMQLDGKTGWYRPCFIGGDDIQNLFADPDEPIRPVAIGANCPWSHCYSAYVLLASGAIPELDIPSYACFRDRLTADGRHWLTPAVAEFFSSKFIDTNEEYSEGKKAYVNALMAIEYKNRRRPMDLEAARHAAERALLAGGIRSVAVWGMSVYTDWLLALLLPTDVKVQYLVDPDIAASPIDRSGLAGAAIPPVMSKFDALPPVDAVIVTDWAHFSEIRKAVPPIYRRLLSITELADHI